jgi:hypothetical protein
MSIPRPAPAPTAKQLLEDAGVIYVAINTELETNAPFLLSQHKWVYSKYFRTYADQNLITELPKSCVDVEECLKHRWRTHSSAAGVPAFYMVLVPGEIVGVLPPYKSSGVTHVKTFGDLLRTMRAYIMLGEHAELKYIIGKFCSNIINQNLPMWAMLANKPMYNPIFNRRTFDLKDIHGIGAAADAVAEEIKAELEEKEARRKDAYDVWADRPYSRKLFFCDDANTVDTTGEGAGSTIDGEPKYGAQIPYNYTPVSPDKITTTRDEIAQIVSVLKSFCARYLDKKGSTAVFNALFMQVYTAIGMKFTTLHLLMIQEVQREVSAIVKAERVKFMEDLLDNVKSKSDTFVHGSINYNSTWIDFAKTQELLTHLRTHSMLYNMVTRNALHVLYLEECIGQNSATTASRWCFARDDVAAWATSSTDFAVSTPYFVSNITSAKLMANAYMTKPNNVMTRVILTSEATSELCKLFSGGLLDESFPWAHSSITGSFLMAASAFVGPAFRVIMAEKGIDGPAVKQWISRVSSSSSEGSSASSSDSKCEYAVVDTWIPSSTFQGHANPDYQHGPLCSWSHCSRYLSYDTVPGYLTDMDKVGAIMAHPDNIRYKSQVRELWMAYYKKLYNTDIDIITDFCTDEEFEVRANKIVAYMGAKYNGCKIVAEKVGSPESFRWRIACTSDIGEPPCPPIDFYRNSFGCIFHYHTQMVRAAHSSALATHNNNSVVSSHMYLSNACSMITGYCFDRRWVKCTSSALAVTNKAAERYYVFVLTYAEKLIMESYVGKFMDFGFLSSPYKHIYAPNRILLEFRSSDKLKTVQEYLDSVKDRKLYY